MEIKFRAWDKKNKIMTYSEVNQINFNGQILLNDGKFHDIKDTDYVLMQYTGFKHNGKKIFKDDIIEVKASSTYLDKVVFDKELCGFRLSGKGSYCDFSDLLREGAKLKVIGNIWENPELLNN
jgi:uncharacterized phage protein (TIGR01671 family)